ncbi:MAG: hypothetical protein ACOYB3_01635 [Azonexus sp.]
MNAKQIARIIEVLFQGEPGGEAPEPLNKRFQWKDPVTGKAPPTPPASEMPTGQDFTDEEDVLPGSGVPVSQMGKHSLHDLASTPSPGSDGMPSDRIGKHSMNDLLPSSEMATIDNLLDTYLQMQKTQGPAAAKAWFDRYRTAEFESLVQRMAAIFLGEAIEDIFKVPEKDLPFIQQLADEQGITLEQAVADYLEMYGNEPAGSKPIRMSGGGPPRRLPVDRRY